MFEYGAALLDSGQACTGLWRFLGMMRGGADPTFKRVFRRPSVANILDFSGFLFVLQNFSAADAGDGHFPDCRGNRVSVRLRRERRGSAAPS